MLIIAIFLIYSVIKYKKSIGEKSETFVVCDKNNKCIIALHIHAEMEIKICGKEIKLPLESGDLRRTHTHKERNLLHFEERLKYDNEKKQIIEKEPITLKDFFNNKEINIKFNSTCIADKCNNDPCGTAPEKVKFYVNDYSNNDFENYVWKDGDKINIIFGPEGVVV